MELMALDKDFKLLGYLPYINLQWNRRYYEAGDYTAQIRKVDYMPDMAYLYSNERPEVGLVQKIETQRNVKGEFVLVGGFFAEKLADRNIVYPKLTMTAKPSEIANKAIRDYAPDGFSFAVDSTNLGEETSVEWFGNDVATALFEMLQTQELSQRVYFDYLNDRLKYTLWQGVDRTQSQDKNAWALFTDESAHVTDFNLTEDDSGYKNFAVVLYGNKEEPTVMEVDVRKDKNEPKRRLFIEHYGTDQNEDELRQEAKERLQEYAKIEKADIKTINEGLVYMQDYDLGDKCDVINHKLAKSYEARLIAVNEVFKQGRHVVSLEFGEKIPTVYNKLNRLVRSMRS